jgi:hypothetical protein
MPVSEAELDAALSKICGNDTTARIVWRDDMKRALEAAAAAREPSPMHRCLWIMRRWDSVVVALARFRLRPPTETPDDDIPF